MHLPKRSQQNDVAHPGDGMDYCLNVPRYPQRFETGDWPAGVIIDGEGPDYWSDRACGLACLRMIIAHFGKPVPSQYELLIQGLEQRAYSPQGWIHQGLAQLGERYGINASLVTVENGDQLQSILETMGPIIASVTLTFPEDGRRGGHLVVICGRHKQPEPSVSFRDPSGWGASNSIVSEKRFFRSFSGRGICFSKKTDG